MIPHENHQWTYWLGRASPEVEYAFWAGGPAPALGMHFHPESQLTTVHSGCRAFQVGSVILRVEAGQCLHIPAGMPHRSLAAEPEGAQCLNLYAALPDAGCGPTVYSLRELGLSEGEADPLALLRGVGERLQAGGRLPGHASDDLWLGDIGVSSMTVGKIAVRHGLSREGFSRRFTRLIGMSPHAYRLMHRLNAARRDLRSETSVADIAAKYGFADQSHLGRHFRRVFGATPRAYGENMRAVTNVPDVVTATG
ncbi:MULTISPECIES: AraC family transcriptional regulator [Ensifer]|jgi:AraC-like DNA-binding protein|nr:MULTISPECIES: AraC family transcriptional regulator [Ensifer]MDP9630291.1 AraC-like DNA-binding protein [Ensifer adhaerens]KQW53925.1 hypothetical protein ASD02_31155 [Ensifer sp. Root1252]KQW83285.1 hypothetical protein ASD03_21550 [Ensifer sp. Root127]KQY68794.1 hypothetical protein ASD52_32880 [Ensifer sp. Root142]KRC69101.1 hypothetical protein ASE32_34855 [Ensifer sp. Root231]